MTDEINAINTDLKELFSENKLDELGSKLDELDDAIVIEITSYNYDIIKKYYVSEKYNILIQYIKFVAFSSFLCEYSIKRKLYNEQESNAMTNLFIAIYNIIQESKK